MLLCDSSIPSVTRFAVKESALHAHGFPKRLFSGIHCGMHDAEQGAPNQSICSGSDGRSNLHGGGLHFQK
jgi:hypothetical protein